MEVAFQGPAGRLEGILEEPEEGEVRGAAVVCHPHPLHGGTMRNAIVVRTARALRSVGMATLRFDFRGVEGSQGAHHGGSGPASEEGDVSAALDLLAARHSGLPLWAAGYSFGSRTVCALAARERRIERLILIALPVSVYDCSSLGEVDQPGLLLFGSGDEFGTATELAARFPHLPARLEVDQIEGADHFFRGRTPLLEDRVREYAQEAWQEAT